MNQENLCPNPPASQRQPRRSDTEKAKDVLRYMADKCSYFSLRQFLETVFTSQDGDIQRSANTFLTSGRACGVMDEWAKKIPSEEMLEWVMKKATKACRQEFSFLTDRASRGPHQDDANFLRLSADQVSVSLLEEFKLDDLNSRYMRVTPQFQHLLKGIIGKDGDEENLTEEMKVRGRTLVTSMVLNLRSRRTNYHSVINGLVLWDNRVHKRVHQVFNHYGISSSYPFLLKGLKALSRDALRMARTAAADESKIKAFLYDNFNWVSRAWEATAAHGNVTHDEVSAILLVLP
ncbi:hypothetical protein BDZ97DRAFT_1659640, partial [Flammula alnicola]